MKKLMKMVLSAGCLVLGASRAFGESVDYWYLSTKQTVDATRITTGGSVGGGWYYAEGDVELNLPLLCIGTTETPARIILKDGARLVLRGVTDYPGLYVGANSKLEIYGQRLGTGKLIAYGSANAPGIGGVASSGSTTCGSITVYGGNVEAHGGVNAPGIGGAYVSGGAGGLTGLTVVGGSVRAYGGANAPGVGGANGFAGLVMNVTVTMGSLEAFGAEGRYGIGPGVIGTQGFFHADNGNVNAVMTGTTGAESCSLVGQGLQVCASRYIRGIGAMNLTANTSEIGYGIWWLAQGEIVRGSLKVNGSAHLVLWDWCDLKVSGGDYQPGIEVSSGNLLEILGGPTGSGKLTATGGEDGAGIGGGREGTGGIITINGGTVTAQGGVQGAGIGGGWAGTGGTVTINGGTVMATGGYCGAGIGGGRGGAGGVVTIDGGDVTVRGNNSSDIHGSLILGDHAIKVGDNHWQESVIVSFNVPDGLRLLSARSDGGPCEVTENGAARRVKILKGRRLTLTFAEVDFEARMEGDATLTVGPVNASTVLDASQLPRAVEVEVHSAVEYALPDGQIRLAETVHPLYSTDRFMSMGQGVWYVVEGEVTTAGIEVHGEGNLILADGAKLTVNGGIRVDAGNTLTIYGQRVGNGQLVANGVDIGAAGIGARKPNYWAGDGNCGAVTINGGTVTAMGGDAAAGIGGAWGRGGVVAINGGTVTATGGKNAAGIGGGNDGAGGTVTINGGTVTATGGEFGAGVGGGKWRVGGTLTIDGGSVKASSIHGQPHNGDGQDVYCVTVEVEGLKVEKLKVEGLDGYGTRDVYPIDGKVYLYLPNGTHAFVLSDGTAALNFYAVVNGRDTAIEPQGHGFTVNGTDIATVTGTGWNYGLDGCLHFTAGGTYVLSGMAMNNAVQVSVEASGTTLVLSNAVVFAHGRPALMVDASLSDVALGMAGNVSYLVATNDTATGESVSAVQAGSGSEIFLASGGERLESMICVFNFGDAPVIDGEAPYVGSGSLCVWADEAAARKAIGYDAASEIMAVGDDPDSTLYATESIGAKCVLVAPFCRVLVPAVMPGIASYVVSNQEERISASETVVATNVFRVMVHDSVTVDFVAAEGYEIVDNASISIPSVTNDVVIGSEAYPIPDVRRQLTVTLPESLEGMTYVVTENGNEVEKVGVGVAVYLVRSGMNVEVVCTAEEGWRIVSETNVVTFANIQESQVPTAAELPQAWRLFTVTVPEVENAYYILTSSDELPTGTDDDADIILSNSVVTVTFVAVGNYRITANGAKTWTLTADVAFGTTEGFPLPTVEGIPGTIAAPWSVGENVQAYTNDEGVLTITGTGAMSNFANAADVPWDPDTVTHVAVEDGVVQLGANSFAALDDAVTVNGTTMSMSRFVAPALGAASSQPSGSISGAEFERIDIVDGKAYLDVSVWTNASLEVEKVGGGGDSGWGVATNGVIEVPAPGKQGFFILQSKAVPLNAPHALIFIPEIIEE